MSIPENHVIAEGHNLKAAIEAAAVQLGVPAAMVEHKLDLAHFRSASGAGVGADTVKIFAWKRDGAEVAPVLDAEAWMRGLLTSMGREGRVSGVYRNGAVTVHVDVGEEGRHLVGRGGTTLRAIQYLMERALEVNHPGKSFRIDVARSEEDRGDERSRDERPRDDRPRDDRPREDTGAARGDRRDGPRRDDRGPRRDDRGPRRDDRGGPRRDDRGPRRSESDSDDLRRLARKIAAVVLERGAPEVIRRELNSYDRRLVHVEISSIPGVASRSVGEGYDRRVEIYIPEGGDDRGDDRGPEETQS